MRFRRVNPWNPSKEVLRLAWSFFFSLGFLKAHHWCRCWHPLTPPGGAEQKAGGLRLL